MIYQTRLHWIVMLANLVVGLLLLAENAVRDQGLPNASGGAAALGSAAR